MTILKQAKQLCYFKDTWKNSWNHIGEESKVEHFVQYAEINLGPHMREKVVWMWIWRLNLTSLGWGRKVFIKPKVFFLISPQKRHECSVEMNTHWMQWVYTIRINVHYCLFPLLFCSWLGDGTLQCCEKTKGEIWIANVLSLHSVELILSDLNQWPYFL